MSEVPYCVSNVFGAMTGRSKEDNFARRKRQQRADAKRRRDERQRQRSLAARTFSESSSDSNSPVRTALPHLPPHELDEEEGQTEAVEEREPAFGPAHPPHDVQVPVRALAAVGDGGGADGNDLATPAIPNPWQAAGQQGHQVPDEPQEPDEPDDVGVNDVVAMKEGLVGAIARVRAKCHMSENAMAEMWKVSTQPEGKPAMHPTKCCFLQVAYENAETIVELKRAKAVTASYRWSIRQPMKEGVPKVTFSVLIEHRSRPAGEELEYITGMDVVPQDYSGLAGDDDRVFLRQDGKTTLQEIKNFHMRKCQKLGLSRREFLDHLWSMDFSADGVKESNCSRRTLVICSVRLHKTIYLFHVLNPLIGNPKAKPSIDDILRWGNVFQWRNQPYSSPFQTPRRRSQCGSRDAAEVRHCRQG